MTEERDVAKGRFSCRCGRTWSGYAACHCGGKGGCHRQFGSVSSFDKHRVGGQCHDPATLTRKDGTPSMAVAVTKFGDVWGVRDDRPQWRGPDSDPDAPDG